MSITTNGTGLHAPLDPSYIGRTTSLFARAQYAFGDPDRVIAEDVVHSQIERRYFCIGKVDDGIMTVRFTYRKRKIRIIGAGYWRKGKDIYYAKRP